MENNVDISTNQIESVTPKISAMNMFKMRVQNFFNSFGKKRKLFGGFLGILVLAGALGAGAYLVQQRQSTKTQAGSVVLSMSSSNPAPQVGDSFVVAVSVNTNGAAATAALIVLRYPTDKLQVTNIKASGNFLPVVLSPGGTDSTDTPSSRSAIALGALIDNTGQPAQPTDAHPKSGTGLLAEFTFKAKATGAASITFGTGSVVTVVGSTADAIGSSPALNLTIGSASLLRATSAPMPSPGTSVIPGTGTPVPTKSPTPKPATPKPPTCIPGGASCSGFNDTRCCAPNLCRNPNGQGFYCKGPTSE